jgi:hypothetical protein
VQDKEKVLVPYTIFTSPLPEVPLSPVQSLEPLAEHEVAFEDEKVKVTVVPVATDEDDALKFTVGAGLDGTTGAEPPPPPPPPQLARINVEVRI